MITKGKHVVISHESYDDAVRLSKQVGLTVRAYICLLITGRGTPNPVTLPDWVIPTVTSLVETDLDIATPRCGEALMWLRKRGLLIRITPSKMLRALYYSIVYGHPKDTLEDCVGALLKTREINPSLRRMTIDNRMIAIGFSSETIAAARSRVKVMDTATE